MAIHKGILFICLLLFITLVLFLIKILTANYNNNVKYSKKIIRLLGYGYILFFAMSAGLLIYLGLEDLKDFINIFLKEKHLSSLISVTILLFFCFTYAALLKDILEHIFDKRITIDEWDNVVGFLVGRVIIIILIFYLIKIRLIDRK